MHYLQMKSCAAKRKVQTGSRHDEIKVILQVVIRGRDHSEWRLFISFEASIAFGILQRSFHDPRLFNTLATG